MKISLHIFTHIKEKTINPRRVAIEPSRRNDEKPDEREANREVAFEINYFGD